MFEGCLHGTGALVGCILVYQEHTFTRDVGSCWLCYDVHGEQSGYFMYEYIIHSTFGCVRKSIYHGYKEPFLTVNILLYCIVSTVVIAMLSRLKQQPW